MNRVVFKCLIGAVIAGGGLSASAQVASPEVREAVLQRAERLEVVLPTEITGWSKQIVDPFYPNSGMQSEENRVAEDPAAPPLSSDRVILDRLAGEIRPSGVMRF